MTISDHAFHAYCPVGYEHLLSILSRIHDHSCRLWQKFIYTRSRTTIAWRRKIGLSATNRDFMSPIRFISISSVLKCHDFFLSSHASSICRRWRTCIYTGSCATLAKRKKIRNAPGLHFFVFCYGFFHFPHDSSICRRCCIFTYVGSHTTRHLHSV